jgi:peptidyl-prolyl cis-trans isomerase D
MKTMTDAAQKLQSGANAAEVVRKAQSQFAYTGMAATKRAYPSDIAAKLDSMAVGQTSAVFETAFDNTLNVVKLIAKTQAPDSIEYRQIQVGGATAEAAKKTADSIYTALKAGADFEQLAQKYGQTGAKQWLTSAMYENSNTIDEESKNYLAAINNLAVNDVKNLEFAQGNIVLQVTARKAMVEKYDAAVIKHTIDFSKQTYSEAYNKFSQFVSENKTIEDMEKNAGKFGFKVTPRQDLFNYEHNVANLLLPVRP